MGYLDGKAAIVTGGGTGIGRATSLLFAKEGADVAVDYSRSQKEAEETVAAIEQMGRKGLAVCADVVDDGAAREMVDRAVSDLGRLDILVNNAGATRFVALDDLEGVTDADWAQAIDVNVKGTFQCSRAAIPRMRESGGGVIVNVASIAGMIGLGSSIPYCVSKAGVISITRSLALTQAPDIRVNAVSPGVVDTRWVAGHEAFVEKGREATPLKRVASPEDVAAAILGLVVSEFVTGQTVVVDGGRTLG
ncbi:MAG: SDR family NAD(P)-dependent oxidoreductase [Candidatus Latescibacteria bacterium]|jgi:3-oxoacyl-[acyl-carrier protein] reductase|nr:SDR family NAD(P)-dependent oxidoreductase [Candidatus Latescibacterota bacterium]